MMHLRLCKTPRVAAPARRRSVCIGTLRALLLVGVAALALAGCAESLIGCKGGDILLYYSSLRDFACPDQPTDTVGDARVLQGTSNTEIVLSWTNPSQRDLSRIEIQWSTVADAQATPIVARASLNEATTINNEDSSGTIQLTDIKPRQAMTHTVAGISEGITYQFAINAIDTDGNIATVKDIYHIPPPTTLTAVVGNGQITLNWYGVPGATEYRIYRATASGERTRIATILAVLTTTSYTDSGLTNGTSYSYTVRAAKGDSEGAGSNSITATPLAPAGAPASLTATARNGQVALAWTAPASGVAVTEYRIYRATGSNIGTATRLVTTPAILPSTTRTYTDSSAANGTEYTYTVRAVNANGAESVNSNTVTGTPDSVLPAVSSVQISTVDATTATVTAVVNKAGTLFWVAYTDGTDAPANTVALIADAGKATTAPIVANSGISGIPVVAAGTVTISITGLVIGTSYDLYAAAKDAAGNNSVLSAKLALSTLPPAVTDLSAVAVGGGTTNIALSWTLPAAIPNDAAKLQLRYATTRAGLATAAPVDIATTRADILTTAGYTLTAPLTSGTQYHIAVLIVNSAGNSLPLSGTGFTDSVSYVTTGTPASTLPGIPTNLRVTALEASSGSVSVTVEWQNPINAENIELSWTPNPNTETITTTAAGTTQSTTITLTGDTTYTISAVAINSSSERSSAASITNQRIDLAAPAAPTGVSVALAADRTATVSWTASTSEDAAGYEVLWATAAAMLPADPVGRQAVGTLVTSATTGVLPIGATYYFVVIASDSANALGAVRTSSSATENIALPGIPTNLRATALAASSGSVGVTVQWQNPANAANIELSWTPATPTPGKSDPIIATAAGTTQSATITLTDNATYTISAVAISSSDVRSSAISIPNQLIDITAPAAPTGVSLALAENGTVTATWALSTSTDVTGYEVIWATAADMLPASIVGRQTVAATETSVTTGALTIGTTYYFVVIASDGINALGAVRTSSSTTANAVLPGIPTNLSVTGLMASSGSVSVTVEWQNPVNAANIELSWTPATPTPGKSDLIPATAAGTTQSATITLTDDTTYTISAVAISSSDVRSSAARITDQRVDLVAPAVATDVSLTPLGNGAITVSWTASTSTDLTGYEVLWATAAAMLPDNPVGRQTVAISATLSVTTGVLTTGTTYYFVVLSSDGANVIGAKNTSSTAAVNAIAPIVTDSNGNTLIDISNLDMLNSIRCNLAGTTYLAANSGGTCATSGGLQCGTDGITACTGYELMRSFDFATAGDYASGAVNTAWRPSGGTPATATNAGWAPIGTTFSGIFEGNSHTISNLYVRRSGNAGLFHQLSGTLRNLGLIDGHAYGSSSADRVGMAVAEMNNSGSSVSNVSARNGSVNGEGGNDDVGGVVGIVSNGTVSNSYSTATVNGGAGIDDVGGLAGVSNNATINGSYASGAVNGDAGNDRVGGLIGVLAGSSFNSRIIASHATGAVDGGTGSDDVGGFVGENSGLIFASYATGTATVAASDTSVDNIGGFVGENNNRITASYATGNAIGGAGDGGTDPPDHVGGFVGINRNTLTGTRTVGRITASYATGNASGGAGIKDNVGGFAGRNAFTITASYATGNASGGAGMFDFTGAFIGSGGVSDISSYGFGNWSTDSEPVEIHFPSFNPSPPSDIMVKTGIAGARQLTAGATPTTTAAGASWNDALKFTMGAWNFGTATQAPALVYADYDGTSRTGRTYSCALFPANIPGTATPIVCGTTLLPGQPR